MKVEQAVREFKFNGMALADPGATMSAEEVKAFYANIYPELNNAEIEGPEHKGAKAIYEFRRAVGTKGTDMSPTDRRHIVTPGVLRIMKERHRQIAEERFTDERDDGYTQGELLQAAICYAFAKESRVMNLARGAPHMWPWSPAWWKPRDRIEDLTRAGALIAAEIDRLLRAQAES